MSLVVCGIHPSVNAAYRAKAKELSVSRTAVYDKLNGVEPFVSAALVRETAASMANLIEFVVGKSPQLLPGYKVRVLDGNCLAKTDHRLEVLRKTLPNMTETSHKSQVTSHKLKMVSSPCFQAWRKKKNLVRGTKCEK